MKELKDMASSRLYAVVENIRRAQEVPRDELFLEETLLDAFFTLEQKEMLKRDDRLSVVEPGIYKLRLVP